MIDLTNYITIGQYINNGSFLQKLDPRIKVLCGFFLIILVLYISSFVAFALLLIFALLLLPLSKLSFKYILLNLKPAFIFISFIFIFQVLFYQNTANAHIFWQWQFLSISMDGIINSLKADIRAVFLYYFVLILTFTTSNMDFADGTEYLLKPLQKIKIPIQKLVMVFTIALKFVPIFIIQLDQLIKARIVRGIQLDKGNFITRTIKFAPLLIPLFIGGFRRAELLTTAIEARGYRSGNQRTRLKSLKLHQQDIIVMLLLFVFSGLLILINLQY